MAGYARRSIHRAFGHAPDRPAAAQSPIRPSERTYAATCLTSRSVSCQAPGISVPGMPSLIILPADGRPGACGKVGRARLGPRPPATGFAMAQRAMGFEQFLPRPGSSWAHINPAPQIRKKNSSNHNSLRLSRSFQTIKSASNHTRDFIARELIAGGPQTRNRRPEKNSPRAGNSAQEDKRLRPRFARNWKIKIGKDGFKVHVQGGVATWEG